jgi:hypothetical protein
MKKLGLLFAMVITIVFTVSCVTKEVPMTETYYETEYNTESYIEVGEEQQEDLMPKWTQQAYAYLAGFKFGELGESHYDGYEISTAKLSKSQVKLILDSLSQKPAHFGPWAIQVVDLTGLGLLTAPPPRNPWEEKTVWENGVKKIIVSPKTQEWLDNLNAITTDPKRAISFTTSEDNLGLEIMVDVTGVEEFMVITCTIQDRYPVIEKVQLIWSEEVTKERQVPYQVEKQRTVVQTEKVPFWQTIFH